MKRVGFACCLFLAFLLTAMPQTARKNRSPVPAFDGLLGLPGSRHGEEANKADSFEPSRPRCSIPEHSFL